MADLWQLCRLGDVAEVVRETINPATLGDQDVYYYSIPAYDSGHPETTPASAIRSNKLRIGPDTILVSRINPQIPRTWRPRPVEKHLALASTEFVPLRAKAGVDSAFLFQVCRSPDFYHSMTAMATGTTGSHQRVDLSGLLNIRLSLPPLSEQRAIAEVLGALDDKIEANRRVADLCDALWQTVAAEVFDYIEDGVITSGDLQPLSSIATFVNGKAFTKNATGTGRMVVRIAELNSGPGASTIYNEIEVPAEHIAAPGDLLFAWSGSLTVQRWYRPEAIINQHIFKVVPRSNIPMWCVHAHLLRLLPAFRRIAAGKATTMGHIQRHDLDVEVGVPDSNMLTRLDSVCAPLWHRALRAEMETLILSRLRDTLLPKLMSGEIRVRGNDIAALIEVSG